MAVKHSELREGSDGGKIIKKTKHFSLSYLKCSHCFTLEINYKPPPPLVLSNSRLQPFLMPHTTANTIRRAVCTTLFSTNCCTSGCGKAQMGRGHFFIGCSIPKSPTHLVCSEKHLCTNLFVTIHWGDYLSSGHALVVPRCLKNMASQ